MTDCCMKTLNNLRDMAHNNAVAKGFHQDTPEVGDEGWMASDGMKLALIHSEVSEVLEALREGNLPHEHWYKIDADAWSSNPANEDGTLRKCEGVPAELADIIIRILDYCGSRRIDIAKAVSEKMAFNSTRPAMHGKRF